MPTSLSGDAQALPYNSGSCDAVVLGLVLNFVPEPATALRNGARRTAGGCGGGVRLGLRRADPVNPSLLGAAGALDEHAVALDEGRRFPLCGPEPLTQLFRDAGLMRVEARAIDVPTIFPDFDAYWTAFLSGQGPAPAICHSA